MFFNRNNKDRATNPVWLKWMVMLFIGYAIFINYTERQKQAQQGVVPVAGQKDVNAASKRADFGAYNLPAGIHIGGEIDGYGAEATCGQTAEVSFRQIIEEAEATEKQQLSLQVGVPLKEHPWAAAVVGMKKDGVREVKVVSKVEGSSDALTSYKIEMNALTPHSGKDFIAFQAIDRKDGSGNTTKCGMEVSVGLTIYGASGKALYVSDADAPLVFTVGQAEYLYGLDRGILGMKQRGKRTLIIPPAFAVLGEKADDALRDAVKEDAMVVAEITLVNLK